MNFISICLHLCNGVGIIGRNGAGKSTLLKILSRITEPTTGSIKIKLSVASLLEVGPSYAMATEGRPRFHPELTGRENIFLNGAILGMSREEIRKHFDAIVDFAEIERLLDTHVKRYSRRHKIALLRVHLKSDRSDGASQGFYKLTINESIIFWSEGLLWRRGS